MKTLVEAKPLRVTFSQDDVRGVTPFAKKITKAKASLEGNPETRSVEIYFDKGTFLRPPHLVLLACLAEEVHNAGKRVFFYFDPTTECGRYLSSLRLGEYWQPGFDREKPTRIDSDKTIYLWKIAKQNMSQYVDQVENLIDAKLYYTKDLNPFRVSLIELFNNVIDHSESKNSGYVICQFYQSEQTICLSVCDLGLGIPTTLNNYWESIGEERKTDPDALKSATKKGVTSKSKPNNKGYGLFNIKSATGKNDGNYIILSNFAFLFSKSDDKLKTYPLKFRFPGTLVDIKIHTARLPNKEEEIEAEIEY